MARENPAWGAPRIHAELLKLDYLISERTVSRWIPRRPSSPGAQQSWKTFLGNHRDCLAAMDFFVVPTANFQILYGWFCIDHGRRKILHFNVTAHPTSNWVIRQLRECWPFDTGTPKYLLSDRDAIFGKRVTEELAGLGIEHKRISYQSPWQNGVAKRWIGSVRRELLGHVIVLNESHLRRLDSPESRPSTSRGEGELIAFPRVGGLRHRYEWARAA